ncbi:hypothetical protein [Vibrio rotiferianus]|uniref:hypothetical protein n=1 Tax=Vibrio rotiferianus TaxID=190895 RepID=UPI00406A6BF0
MKKITLLSLLFFSNTALAKDLQNLCKSEGMISLIENGALYEITQYRQTTTCDELYHVLYKTYEKCRYVIDGSHESMTQLSNELSYCLIVSKFE